MNNTAQRTVVRRRGKAGQDYWGIPNEQMTGWLETFESGLLFDAELDSNVAEMNNDDCHGGKCFGEAGGELRNFNSDFPAEDQIKRRFEIGYCPRSGTFYNKSNSKEPVGKVDVLVLHEDGRCEAIFLRK